MIIVPEGRGAHHVTNCVLSLEDIYNGDLYPSSMTADI